ncbi:MAG: hypothetical protein KME23_07825 [Goleter apudmare HA4340-LM2]|jgi:hypothetical protein|nr:hypothetical protein [Goleter apudmare HA4340-LM2]
MSQNPLIDPGTQSSKTPGLKPVLASALASLEVQLDQELARYRRTRTGTRTLKQPRILNYISGSSQQLTAMTTEDIQSLVAAVTTNASPATVNDALESEPVPVTVKSEAVDHLDLPLNSEPAETQNPAPSTDPASSIVPTAVPGQQNTNLLPPDDAPSQPDDYLESSEALRRSLTDEQSPTRKSGNSNDSLLSPLGIGSMLLLLLASLTLGYIAFNPKSLSQLNFSNLFQGDSSTTADQPKEVESNASPQTQPPLTPIPKYPNLAAKEFPEVRDPNDIVGLQPKVQATPTALPNPVLQPQPINPVDVAPAPRVLPQSPTGLTPAPRVLPQSPINPSPTPTNKTTKQQPKPTPTPTPIKLNSEIKPSADGFYHIVTDNEGDRTLATARQVIPDAYLSLDNKLIYLGALKTPEQVQRQLQLLQSKGIKARVEQP